jgi:hypothetical protein
MQSLGQPPTETSRRKIVALLCHPFANGWGMVFVECDLVRTGLIAPHAPSSTESAKNADAARPIERSSLQVSS